MDEESSSVRSRARRRSREEVRGLLADFAGSGLSQGRWCAGKGISVATLGYWLRRERESPERVHSLVPIEVRAAGQSAAADSMVEPGCREEAPPTAEGRASQVPAEVASAGQSAAAGSVVAPGCREEAPPAAEGRASRVPAEVAAAVRSARPSGLLPTDNLPTGNLPASNLPSDNLPSGNLPSGNPPAGNLPSGNLPVGNPSSGNRADGNRADGKEAPALVVDCGGCRVGFVRIGDIALAARLLRALGGEAQR